MLKRVLKHQERDVLRKDGLSKKCKRLWEEFEVGGVKKRLWEVAKKRMLDDRGALLSEEGNIIREYRANTRNILSVVGTRRLKKKKVKVGA